MLCMLMMIHGWELNYQPFTSHPLCCIHCHKTKLENTRFLGIKVSAVLCVYRLCHVCTKKLINNPWNILLLLLKVYYRVECLDSIIHLKL